MSMARLGLIVAADSEGNIGYRNDIPWRLKGDLKNFRNLTMNQVVIMGRRTYESLPNPLDGRICIVITSNPILCREGDEVHVAQNVAEAIEIGQRFATDWIYFVGGARIYEEAMSLVERAHITLVHIRGEYDTKIKNFRFPHAEWDLVESVPGPVLQDKETGVISTTHTYLTMQRKPA